MTKEGNEMYYAYYDELGYVEIGKGTTSGFYTIRIPKEIFEKIKDGLKYTKRHTKNGILTKTTPIKTREDLSSR